MGGFVDRLGLVVHVLNSHGQCRVDQYFGLAAREAWQAEVFLAIVDNEGRVGVAGIFAPQLARYVSHRDRRPRCRAANGRRPIEVVRSAIMVAQAELREVEPEQRIRRYRGGKVAYCSRSMHGSGSTVVADCDTWKGTPIKRSADRSECRDSVGPMLSRARAKFGRRSRRRRRQT